MLATKLWSCAVTGSMPDYHMATSWVYKVSILVVGILECLSRAQTDTSIFGRMIGVAKIPTFEELADIGSRPSVHHPLRPAVYA